MMVNHWPVTRPERGDRQGGLAQELGRRDRVLDVVVDADAKHGQVGPVDNAQVKARVPRWVEGVGLKNTSFMRSHQL